MDVVGQFTGVLAELTIDVAVLAGFHSAAQSKDAPVLGTVFAIAERIGSAVRSSEI